MGRNQLAKIKKRNLIKSGGKKEQRDLKVALRAR
jgi:hypothetical protein